MDIDTDINPLQKANIMTALKEYYGEDNVLNCITFKTLKLRAAIKTAMKGLGYSVDDAKALTAIVPVDRGHVYTLKECIEGDSEQGFEPAPNVIEAMKKFPRLYETVCRIESLKMNASIHASAVYIFNNGYLEHNSLMRAPNGTKITAYEMNDTNAMSGLKIDLLYTDAENKLMKCMDLLLKNKQIEWQGSLRSTYNKYLHPDVLDYDSIDMWKKASNGEIEDLFQWVTAVGATAIKKGQPRSIPEMATLNSTIRVQSDGELQPIDKYIMFHNDINKWYDEMRVNGLNDEEIEIMKKYLLVASGCSMQQEDFMRLAMEPKIAGFTLGQANKLRKVIAHKILADLVKQKNLFYECCKRQGTRDELANYVWTYCIEPLAKYSFSVIHATAYSIVALQEMNLATRFNPLYWSCACLCANSGNAETDFDEDDEEEDDNNLTTTNLSEKEVDGKKVAPDYGKISLAIQNAQQHGVKIGLPDINTSGTDFTPDIKNNAILYSLSSISGVSDALADKIIANRPYSSWQDLYTRLSPTVGEMATLIKAGCFQSVSQIGRRATLVEFFNYIAEKEFPLKDKLTRVNLRIASTTLGMDFNNYSKEIRLFNFKRFIDKYQVSEDKKQYILTDLHCISFFSVFVADSLKRGEDYQVVSKNEVHVSGKAFNKFFDNKIEPVMVYLNSEEGRKAYQKAEQANFIDNPETGLKKKYGAGNICFWEIQTMGFYYTQHELAKVSSGNYGLVDFNKLDEHPKLNEKGYPDSVAIAGTITKADSNKHIVSLLTTTGVVNVKFYATNYATFSKRITKPDPKNQTKKITVDDSWLKRNNKVIIYGNRREDMFVARRGEKGRMVGLIDTVFADGTMNIRFARSKAE